MNKIISSILLSFFFLQSVSVFADADAEKKQQKFIVTAYYSPLPNQSYYMRGSYEADVVLNGRGTNGASGKEVYIGMLAAPKKYAFGTKIHLEGLGVGVVDDRGGAIVPSGERNNAYDRIDIWMGSGEEGLRRALQWGRRTVSGKVLEDGELTLEVEGIPLAPKSSIASLRIENLNDGIFDKVVDKKSNTNDIKELQKVLAALGFYKEETDGKWNKKIVDAIFDYQMSEKLISGIGDFGAGYFGAKTRQSMEKDYAEYKKTEEKKTQEEKLKKEQQEKLEKALAAKKEAIRKEIASWGDMKLKDVGPEVRALQKTLKKLGYLDEADTAIFGEHTQDALAHFQTDAKVIEDKGIGTYGEKTRDALIEKLALILN